MKREMSTQNTNDAYGDSKTEETHSTKPTMTLQETIESLEEELDMTDSIRVEQTGHSLAHLRD